MSEEMALVTDARRRRTIMIASGIFIAILLGFTLFSNTLASLTLPKVLTEQPQAGELTHTIEGSGILLPKVELQLTGDSGWRVSKLHVKEGDRVAKGQILISFDAGQPLRDIEDEQARLTQMKYAMEKLKDQYIGANREGDEMQIRDAKRNLESFKLDFEIQERKLQRMKEQVEHNKAILAPFDGRVNKIYVMENQPSSPGQSVMLLSDTGFGFQFTFPVSSELAAMLEVGEEMEISVKDKESSIVTGKIAEIKDLEANAGMSDEAGGRTAYSVMKQIQIDILDNRIQGGERVSIRVVKDAVDEVLLVANNAIREDRTGKYVYVVNRKKGPLGNAFYVQKVYIQVIDSNEKETAVTNDLSSSAQIIVESSEPLQDGDRIRLQ